VPSTRFDVGLTGQVWDMDHEKPRLIPSETRDEPIEWSDNRVEEDERPKFLEDASEIPTVRELRREQRREASHTAFVHTQGQIHGALVGALVFGGLGLLIGALIGFLAFDGDSPARFVVPAVVTVFAAWVGLVYGGGRGPEVENETMTIYGEPEDGTSPRRPENDD
jgi:hypothetical protein